MVASNRSDDINESSASFNGDFSSFGTQLTTSFKTYSIKQLKGIFSFQEINSVFSTADLKHDFKFKSSDKTTIDQFEIANMILIHFHTWVKIPVLQKIVLSYFSPDAESSKTDKVDETSSSNNNRFYICRNEIMKMWNIGNLKAEEKSYKNVSQLLTRFNSFTIIIDPDNPPLSMQLADIQEIILDLSNAKAKKSPSELYVKFRELIEKANDNVQVSKLTNKTKIKQIIDDVIKKAREEDIDNPVLDEVTHLNALVKNLNDKSVEIQKLITDSTSSKTKSATDATSANGANTALTLIANSADLSKKDKQKVKNFLQELADEKSDKSKSDKSKSKGKKGDANPSKSLAVKCSYCESNLPNVKNKGGTLICNTHSDDNCFKNPESSKYRPPKDKDKDAKPPKEENESINMISSYLVKNPSAIQPGSVVTFVDVDGNEHQMTFFNRTDSSYNTPFIPASPDNKQNNSLMNVSVKFPPRKIDAHKHTIQEIPTDSQLDYLMHERQHSKTSTAGRNAYCDTGSSSLADVGIQHEIYHQCKNSLIPTVSSTTGVGGRVKILGTISVPFKAGKDFSLDLNTNVISSLGSIALVNFMHPEWQERGVRLINAEENTLSVLIPGYGVVNMTRLINNLYSFPLTDFVEMSNPLNLVSTRSSSGINKAKTPNITFTPSPTKTRGVTITVSKSKTKIQGDSKPNQIAKGDNKPTQPVKTPLKNTPPTIVIQTNTRFKSKSTTGLDVNAKTNIPAAIGSLNPPPQPTVQLTAEAIYDMVVDRTLETITNYIISSAIFNLTSENNLEKVKLRLLKPPDKGKLPTTTPSDLHNAFHISSHKLIEMAKSQCFHLTGPVVHPRECITCVCCMGVKLPNNTINLRDQNGTHSADGFGPIFGAEFFAMICNSSKMLKVDKSSQKTAENIKQSLQNYSHIVNVIQKGIVDSIHLLTDPKDIYYQKIDSFRFDNAKTQTGNVISEFLTKQLKVHVQFTAPLTGATQRGIIENHIFHVRDRAIAFMHFGNVLYVYTRLKYHDYAMNHSVYLHNCFIPGQDGLTPYERKFGVPYLIPLNILSLPLFCVILRFIPQEQRQKNGGGQRFHPTIFLGHAPNGSLSMHSYPRGSIMVSDEKRIYILYKQFYALPNVMYFKRVPKEDYDLDEYGRTLKPLPSNKSQTEPLTVEDLTTAAEVEDATEIIAEIEKDTTFQNLLSTDTAVNHDLITQHLLNLSNVPLREEGQSNSETFTNSVTFTDHDVPTDVSLREDIPPEPPPPSETDLNFVNESTFENMLSLYTDQCDISDEKITLLQDQLHDKAAKNNIRFIDPLDEKIFSDISQDQLLTLINLGIDFIENNKRVTPKSFDEAMNCPQTKNWILSMLAEWFSVTSKDTFKLEEMPRGRFSIPLKWVYKIKLDEFGNWLKDKSRLVVQGFRQREGIDFTATFSPVIRTNLVRFIFATAAQFDLFVHKLDIESAFVYSKVDEEIYVDFPPGIESFLKEAFEKTFNVRYEDIKGTRWRLRLIMSLYGLKQAPRNWYNHLSAFIKGRNLNGCKSEPCLFYRVDGDNIFIVAVFVDDILMIGNDNEEINTFVKAFGKVFNYTHSGKFGPEPNLYLGCEVSRGVDYITITNKTLIKKTLAKPEFDVSHIPTRITPMDSDIDVDERFYIKGDGKHTFPYMELIGVLIYLAVTGTRHEITYAVTTLASFNSCPTEFHWDLALKILAYLRDNIDLGITYHKNWDAKLYPGVPEKYRDWLLIYVDSSFGRNLVTRKSCAGVIIMFAGGPIVARKVNIQINCVSSTEAEYLGMYHACVEAIVLKRIIQEIFVNDRPGLHFSQMLLLEDNESAIKIANQYVSSRRSLHIETKYHYTRELVQLTKEIVPMHIKNIYQKSDGLTKPLDNVLFPKFIDQLNMKVIKNF